MDYSSLKAHFKIRKENGDKCQAICPAHADKQASLSISYDTKANKTLLYCHAGCDTAEIVHAVGLDITDLFDKELDKNKENKNILAIYQYTDTDGNIIYEKVRFKPKKFSQRRYIDGYTIWGLDHGTYYETFKDSNNFSSKPKENARTIQLDAIEPVLYNLHKIAKAETVIITEGEKDADNLNKLGFVATTTFDGASKGRQKWRKNYNDVLKNKNVILIGDNDKVGRLHMQHIASELNDYATTIKLIELPGLKDKEDITNWLEQGNTKEDLVDLIDKTPTYKNINLLNYNFSDVGNAERLIALYGNNLKFNPLQQKWMIWSGRHWRIDENLKVERLAKDVIKRIQYQGDTLQAENEENLEALDKQKKQIKSFVLKSENDSRIKAMLNQSKSQKGVILSNTDKNIYQLNIANGTLNLKSGALNNHNRDDNITKLINIQLNKNGKCDNWVSFLNKIFIGDTELIDYIQKTIGYSLTGDMSEQCFYMCYGGGANGKSTFLNTIYKILGEYADTLKGSSLMVKRNDDGARGDLAKLKNKRFVIASELNDGQTFDESLLKALTGGDTVPVRYLYGEEFPLEPQFKLWIGTNEKPKVKGTNLGIWRRVRLIPFLYTFNDDEKDPDFYEKYIEPELPGILNWSVEGCLKWQREGITLPRKVLMANEEYQAEMDCIGRFLEENTITGEKFSVKASTLYDEYVRWCTENRERELSNVRFSKKIQEKGFSKSKKKNGIFYENIGLLEENIPYKEVQTKIFPFKPNNV